MDSEQPLCGPSPLSPLSRAFCRIDEALRRRLITDREAVAQRRWAFAEMLLLPSPAAEPEADTPLIAEGRP